MTGPKLLLPIRLPELGPSMGKLITGTGNTIQGVSLDSYRYQLVNRVFDFAGEARRLAASEERASALASVGRDAWLSAWEEVVAAIAESLVERLENHLRAEAKAVRMPRTMREHVALDTVEKRALTARLGSAGAHLVSALDDLEEKGASMLHATGLDRHALEAWQQALTLAGRRLEASWLLLESAVASEVSHWLEVADETSRWRKPLWPTIVGGSIATAVALWVGFVMGGFLAVPEWLGTLWQLLP